MTAPPRPSRPPAEYKGGELDAARGPGLGCFYAQLVLLAVLVVLTPASAYMQWPPLVTVGLLVATLALLLIAGQTIIFLLRIVAAERGRRRPLAGRSRTVGEIEAGATAPAGEPQRSSAGAAVSGSTEGDDEGGEASRGDAGDRARTDGSGVRE